MTEAPTDPTDRGVATFAHRGQCSVGSSALSIPEAHLASALLVDRSGDHPAECARLAHPLRILEGPLNAWLVPLRHDENERPARVHVQDGFADSQPFARRGRVSRHPARERRHALSAGRLPVARTTVRLSLRPGTRSQHPDFGRSAGDAQHTREGYATCGSAVCTRVESHGGAVGLPRPHKGRFRCQGPCPVKEFAPVEREIRSGKYPFLLADHEELDAPRVAQQQPRQSEARDSCFSDDDLAERASIGHQLVISRSVLVRLGGPRRCVQGERRVVPRVCIRGAIEGRDRGRSWRTRHVRSNARCRFARKAAGGIACAPVQKEQRGKNTRTRR